MAARKPPALSLADLKKFGKTLAGSSAKRLTRPVVIKIPTEHELFTEAMRLVIPLKPKHLRVEHNLPKPRPLPIQRWADEQDALISSQRDPFNQEWLIENDENISYRRHGLGIDVVRNLRKGKWVVNQQLDLHGYRVDEAHEVINQFIKLSVKHQQRCVRIIHGKGLGSKDKIPVLKEKVRSWLMHKNEVLAFVEARPNDGGAGVVIVLLTA